MKWLRKKWRYEYTLGCIYLVAGCIFFYVATLYEGWARDAYMLSAGVQWGYAIFSVIIMPRRNDKDRAKFKAELDKIGDQFRERMHREMLKTLWSPTIVPPDDRIPPHERMN